MPSILWLITRLSILSESGKKAVRLALCVDSDWIDNLLIPCRSTSAWHRVLSSNNIFKQVRPLPRQYPRPASFTKVSLLTELVVKGSTILFRFPMDEGEGGKRGSNLEHLFFTRLTSMKCRFFHSAHLIRHHQHQCQSVSQSRNKKNKALVSFFRFQDSLLTYYILALVGVRTYGIPGPPPVSKERTNERAKERERESERLVEVEPLDPTKRELSEASVFTHTQEQRRTS